MHVLNILTHAYIADIHQSTQQVYNCFTVHPSETKKSLCLLSPVYLPIINFGTPYVIAFHKI
jgi:hypothetical protein